MRCRSFSTVIAAAAAAAMVAGCSAGSDRGQPGSAASATSTAGAPTTAMTTMSTDTHPAAPGDVGVSPNGVTTAVAAPAESTEDEYFQACHAAKVWMAANGGDSTSQFEPYLQDLQSTDAAGPGTFGSRWSELTPSRQSAVVVAAQAAADAMCG